jgi:hypothetical protein
MGLALGLKIRAVNVFTAVPAKKKFVESVGLKASN